MNLRALVALGNVLWVLIIIAGSADAQARKGLTYPQLISTRYAAGAALPAGAEEPGVRYEFVDKAKLPAGAVVRSAARTRGGAVWVVTDQGTFRGEGDRYVPLDLPRVMKPFQPQVHEDTRIEEVVGDQDGHVWLATSEGVYVTDGEQWWQPLDRRDRLPSDAMTCLALAPNGDVWGGTSDGAWRLRDGEIRYFWGRRWLPGNHVTRIRIDARGRAWITTDGGTACIEEKPITLGEKAAHYESMIQARHNRRGYVNGCGLKRAGDPEGGFVLDASDNDGLWTALYIGAEALRYGATHDPRARQQAKRSMEALLELERLTGIPGFPARAVVTDDELKAGVTGFNPNDEVSVEGEHDKVWFRSPVDPNVWCKGDTSSDEMDGHYFAWYLYHELVADAGEKARIAATVRRVTDHILENGYTLVGPTGRKTRWGVWAPRFLNDDARWHGERGLNSIEILDYLKVAYHICKEERYRAAYEDLISRHHYLLNTLLFRRDTPWWAINHSDDELAYVTYYPLLMLERDPARRRILVQSISRTWEDSPREQTLRAEHSPFYNFIYGATTGKPCDAEAAVRTLQEWPWELVDWASRNSHRGDVTVRMHSGARNVVEIDRVLSPAERRLMRWNSDPWEPDGGGNGGGEEDGAAWLIGYWMGVYHGILLDESFTQERRR